MTPAFRLESIRQSYAGRTVLDLDELEVRRGEVLALVGPSGSGKSTLLRLLNFLETPTEGTLQYEGRKADGERTPLELRRQVTTVFQQTALQKTSVRANVAYGLRLRGLRADGQVDGLLETVGLSELAGAPARRLSGGEKQRVALAWTSPPPTWIPTTSPSSSRSCGPRTGTTAPRWCWSPTTCSRPIGWRTAPGCS
jgi:tungstate transport system ATP-binding protein